MIFGTFQGLVRTVQQSTGEHEKQSFVGTKGAMFRAQGTTDEEMWAVEDSAARKLAFCDAVTGSL